MPIVRTAVLLYEYSEGGQNVNVHGDRLWWSNYFFNPVYGQAGFWLKQTDGTVILDSNGKAVQATTTRRLMTGTD